MYNYLQSIKEDVMEYIKNEVTTTEYFDRDELESRLNDNLWTDDSVTGNASGSYTFCRSTAMEYVTDNMDLCKDAISEFCVDADTVADKFLSEDWEYFDVTIRCYLLGEAIGEALDEMESELTFAEDEE